MFVQNMDVEINLKDGSEKKGGNDNKLKTMRPKSSTKTSKGAKQDVSGQKTTNN